MLVIEVFVARLPVPVVARMGQHPTLRAGAEIEPRAMSQREKTRLVRHEREASPALLIAPAELRAHFPSAAVRAR